MDRTCVFCGERIKAGSVVFCGTQPYHFRCTRDAGYEGKFERLELYTEPVVEKYDTMEPVSRW